MEAKSFPDRFWLVATGLLVITLPAVTLAVAYVALTATRSVAIGQLTLVEAVELYLLEVAAFAVFTYLLYRLTRYTTQQTQPDTTSDESGSAASVEATDAASRSES